jgi:hypothetical protein
MGPFVVDLSLRNYESQTVEIILMPVDPKDLGAGIRLEPNPITVMLKAIPRPAPPPRRKRNQESAWPRTSGYDQWPGNAFRSH